MLSPKTVRNYVSSILSKLQVADRAEAMMRTHPAALTAGKKRGKIRSMIITLPSRVGGKDSAGGRGSYILHERAQEYYGAGTGLLSIKCFFGGRAVYEIGRGRHALDDRSFLIVNQGQPYAVTIESSEEVESFCIFFEPGFVEEVRRGLVTPSGGLLLDRWPNRPETLAFFERTYPHDRLLSPTLFHLREMLAWRPVERAWIEEQLHTIVERLLAVHENVYHEVARLPSARAATREELYRRLSRAKDFAAAAFDQQIGLTDMADVACLSPNHLLRTFKHVFGQTPYQYITGRRIEEAERLLRDTDRSVTEICQAVGFESLGSFSWLFRRHAGVSPAAYRRRLGAGRQTR